MAKQQKSEPAQISEIFSLLEKIDDELRELAKKSFSL